MKSTVLIASILLAGTFSLVACAADNEQKPTSEDQHQSADAKTFSGHGKVNSVDPASGIVNLSHEAIKTLKWPKMTMDFTVRDPSMLKNITPGMEVDFELMKMSGTYQITKITPAPK